MPCSEKHFIPILDELEQRAREAEARAEAEAAARRRHGGPRPGSGPPKGNLNALKHGRTSRRQVELLEAIMEIPEAREALIELAARNRRIRKQAEEGAGVLMTRLLERVAGEL